MSSITDKLCEEEIVQETEKHSSFFYPILIALVVVLTAMFIGEMLFGKNSLEVYLALKNDKLVLEKKIYHLKNQNAALQKKYFELKNVMPSEEDE
jgi:cell division protein FtsB